jgi:hypothetical protein
LLFCFKHLANQQTVIQPYKLKKISINPFKHLATLFLNSILIKVKNSLSITKSHVISDNASHFQLDIRFGPENGYMTYNTGKPVPDEVS